MMSKGKAYVFSLIIKNLTYNGLTQSLFDLPCLQPRSSIQQSNDAIQPLEFSPLSPWTDLLL
jgi:hypothetical protein